MKEVTVKLVSTCFSVSARFGVVEVAGGVAARGVIFAGRLEGRRRYGFEVSRWYHVGGWKRFEIK